MKFSAARKGARRAPRFPSAGSRLTRRPVRSTVVGLAILGVVATGVGVAVAASDGSGSMTVTQDGAIVDGQEIKGFVHVKADNVTIRNSTIRYGGDHAIQVFDGSVGTVIEATRVHCEKDQTNGIVFGGYVARRVEVFGCRNGFLYSDESPATIIDSTWNGQPVETAAAVEPTDTPAPASAAPSATKTATPKPSPRAAGADRQRSAGTFDGPSGYPGPDNTGVPSGTTLRPSG